MIKLHEFVVKSLNNVLPAQILELDRNISLMILPLIILGAAQVPSMIWNSFLALLGLGPVQTAWSKSSNKSEFNRKFSFDQIDQQSQINAVSQEINNANCLIADAK